MGRDGTGFIIEGIGPTFCSFTTSTGIERAYLCYMLPRETVGELHIMEEMGNRETERVVNFWLTDLEDGNDCVCTHSSWQGSSIRCGEWRLHLQSKNLR